MDAERLREIRRIDLEVAERMAETFDREVAQLPEESELRHPMAKAVGCWRGIAERIALRELED